MHGQSRTRRLTMARCMVKLSMTAGDGRMPGQARCGDWRRSARSGAIRRISLPGREQDGSSMPSFSRPEISGFGRNPAATGAKRRTHPSRVHPYAEARRTSYALAAQHGGRVTSPHAAAQRQDARSMPGMIADESLRT